MLFMLPKRNRKRYLLPRGRSLRRASGIHKNVQGTTSRPTQPIATRPLDIQKDSTWYCYGWDLTKNICEIYSTGGYIHTVYTYTPYGEVTASGSVAQSPRGLGGGLDKPKGIAPQGRGRNGVRPSHPVQWSSEYADTELGLVYYNYRYYNPLDGRWIRRDPIGIKGGLNLYTYLSDYPVHYIDILGNAPDYKPEEWNNLRYQYTNNCYSYACDLKIDGKDIPGMIFKLQPGQLSGTYEPVPAGGFTCELIMSRAQADGLYVTSAEKDCQCKYHKVALIVGPNDYHWYRLDSNGYWSHKPGSYPVTNLDANGDLINNPETAKWSNIYTKFCSYMCAPSNSES